MCQVFSDILWKFCRPKKRTSLFYEKSMTSFSYTLSIPSSELRAAISDSKAASLTFPSGERNLLELVSPSQICIPFFHVLYLSVSKTGGEVYFEAIVPFNSATSVNLKIMEHNMNYETTTTADIQRENIYLSSSKDYHIYNNGGLTTSD